MIRFLYVLTYLGLIGALVYVCIEDYPLWSVTVILVMTILYPVFGVLITDNKDGKRLLLWGGLGGIVFVGIILILAFLNIQIPTYLKCLAYPIGHLIGSKFADKKL